MFSGLCLNPAPTKHFCILNGSTFLALCLHQFSVAVQIMHFFWCWLGQICMKFVAGLHSNFKNFYRNCTLYWGVIWPGRIKWATLAPKHKKHHIQYPISTFLRWNLLVFIYILLIEILLMILMNNYNVL